MNKNLKMLADMASKPVRKVVGLMSGTSLDGLDVALCCISGCGTETEVKLEHFKSIPYPEEIKSRLRRVLHQPKIELESITLLNAWLGDLMASFVLDCLKDWKVEAKAVDVIASHGQTVYHAPKSFHKKEHWPNATLQIGDGDHIAVRTGIITLSDFRQKHVAAGGEGAPLAVYGDYALYHSRDENRILINIGGISNFTFLPKNPSESNIFVSDTGPGNALMDAAMKSYYEKAYDKDGLIAASGEIDQNLLNLLKEDDFFKTPFPKTTGTELFNIDFINSRLKTIERKVSRKDLLATLNYLTAITIKEGLKPFLNKNQATSIYLSGGGALNPTLFSHLKNILAPYPVFSSEELGIVPEAKEAVLFAVLANETIMGNQSKFTNLPSVTMGKISLPE